MRSMRPAANRLPSKAAAEQGSDEPRVTIVGMTIDPS
jgi:hypothetical protein